MRVRRRTAKELVALDAGGQGEDRPLSMIAKITVQTLLHSMTAIISIRESWCGSDLAQL